MLRRRKIIVVTGLFPTRTEPYRGRAIWSTLHELRRHADLDIFCTLPRYPSILRPRSFRYHAEIPSTDTYGLDARVAAFYAIPWLTRSWNASSICRALRRQLSDAPDLVLSYYVYPEGYAGLRLAEALGIPAVVGARGSDLRAIDRNRSVQKMTRATVRRSAALICVSDDLAEIARGMGGTPERIYTVRNGVDRNPFGFRDRKASRSELGISIDDRIVLFVGWLSRLKRVPQLIDAIALLNQRSSRPWRLLLAGEGQLEPALRAQAAGLKLQDQVQFLGPLNPQQVAAWMQACDCLCLPSETEGCPNVVVEALSCGTPVVASAVGGIPELLTADSGIQIAQNSAAAIAEGLEQAARRTWDREQIARVNCRGWDQVGRETYEICEHVLSRSRTSAPEASEVAYGAH